MPERRLPTLADARRQVWVRGIIGWLLIGLPVIFLLLVLVKDLYHTPAGLFFPPRGLLCTSSLTRSYETGASWPCCGGRSHPRSRGLPYRQPRSGIISMSFGAPSS